MKRLLGGVRAVVIELCGVLAVVWLLFGFTALGLHGAAGTPPRLPEELSRQWDAWKEHLLPAPSSSDLAAAQREQYVEDRLRQYSRNYAQVARRHIDSFWPRSDWAEAQSGNGWPRVSGANQMMAIPTK